MQIFFVLKKIIIKKYWKVKEQKRENIYIKLKKYGHVADKKSYINLEKGNGS